MKSFPGNAMVTGLIAVVVIVIIIIIIATVKKSEEHTPKGYESMSVEQIKAIRYKECITQTSFAYISECDSLKN